MGVIGFSVDGRENIRKTRDRIRFLAVGPIIVFALFALGHVQCPARRALIVGANSLDGSSAATELFDRNSVDMT
jgi:hypothetical protein